MPGIRQGSPGHISCARHQASCVEWLNGRGREPNRRDWNPKCEDSKTFFPTRKSYVRRLTWIFATQPLTLSLKFRCVIHRLFQSPTCPRDPAGPRARSPGGRKRVNVKTSAQMIRCDGHRGMFFTGLTKPLDGKTSRNDPSKFWIYPIFAMASQGGFERIKHVAPSFGKIVQPPEAAPWSEQTLVYRCTSSLVWPFFFPCQWNPVYGDFHK